MYCWWREWDRTESCNNALTIRLSPDIGCCLRRHRHHCFPTANWDVSNWLRLETLKWNSSVIYWIVSKSDVVVLCIYTYISVVGTTSDVLFHCSISRQSTISPVTPWYIPSLYVMHRQHNTFELFDFSYTALLYC